MDTLKFIFICLEVLVLFNVLIFVHELGHFWAARWRGLKAERFAIWFGKPIWSKNINGVEFALGWIPFGGYVSLPQMSPMDMIEGGTDQPREPLPQISALDKIIVAFAGPLFSFLLAVAFALIVWVTGRPVSESETTTVIGHVLKGGPAEKAGLQVGDRLLEVDGKPVTKFGGMGNSIMWSIARSEGETIPIKFERAGEVKSIEVTPIKPPTKMWERRSLRQIQIEPANTPVVGLVFTNSPADRAGLRRFDQIIEVNGKKMYHFAQVSQMVAEAPDAPLTLRIRRDTNEFTAQITAEKPLKPAEEKPMLGLRWADGRKMDLVYPNPVEQISTAVTTMINTFSALLSRGSEIGVQHLSGAVKILNIYYMLFQSEQGWRLALWFSVVINVNLAILNMVPLPVLDGGHIVLAIIDSCRRRPVSAKTLQTIQSACAFLLIGFMLFVTFFDVQELGGGKGRDKNPPDPQFAPKAAAPATPRP
jgi:regulator of sigma E protease